MPLLTTARQPPVNACTGTRYVASSLCIACWEVAACSLAYTLQIQVAEAVQAHLVKELLTV